MAATTANNGKAPVRSVKKMKKSEKKENRLC